VPPIQATEFQIRWVQRQCPALWGILNTRAQIHLPPGIVEHLSRPGALAGRANLKAVNRLVDKLVRRLGETSVAAAYRRDLSGIGSEDALRDLLCEISLGAELSVLTDQIVLRPKVGGRRSDLRAKIGGHEVWAEVKRYEDRWLTRESLRLGRALTMRGYRHFGRTVLIPRSQELRQKLDASVPEQLPEDAIGVLFLFHSGSLGRDEQWIAGALFGDAYSLGGLTDAKQGIGHKSNGLFVLQRWQRVSACCWVRIMPDTRRARLLRMWHNPLATRVLPSDVPLAIEQIGRE
jgi:hypothetical protein